MEGERVRARCRRAHAGRRRAQATVEFAVVVPLFLACFLAAVDAGLWAIQTSAEVSAVEQAAMLAASAGSSPIAQTAPDARDVTAAVAARLRSALFGTGIASWCETAADGSCLPDTAERCPASPAEVQAREGPRVVVICVSEQDPPVCVTPPPGVPPPYPAGCDDSPLVTVRVIGFVASLVPPGFGAGARAFEIPTDIWATTHTLRYAR
jgi:TadE-like protein